LRRLGPPQHLFWVGDCVPIRGRFQVAIPVQAGLSAARVTDGIGAPIQSPPGRFGACTGPRGYPQRCGARPRWASGHAMPERWSQKAGYPAGADWGQR